jgi:hypothetical protein
MPPSQKDTTFVAEKSLLLRQESIAWILPPLRFAQGCQNDGTGFGGNGKRFAAGSRLANWNDGWFSGGKIHVVATGEHYMDSSSPSLRSGFVRMTAAQITWGKGA